MKILWFPRIQPDIGKLHLTTWREMCRELESLGCDVRIAVTGKDEDNVLERDVIRIQVIRKKFLRMLSFWIIGYSKFIYHYLTFRPDAVILDISSIWFSLPRALFKKKKTVFIIDERTPRYNLSSSEDTLQDRGMRFYTKLCYLYARYFLDGITVITTYFRDYVHKNYDFPLHLIEVWGSGVDINMFYPQKCGNMKERSFLENKFVLIQHGEFSNNRGILETIEAVKLVDREDVCMLLIGEGKIKQEIDRKIADLHLSERVYVFPPKPHSEIPKYLSCCNCAVMAYPDIEYWNNNNPIKLLEYLAMGKVVICTDMWTFRNVADDSKCLFFINDNNPESVAEAINYCYENRLKLDEWGKEGISIVREKYTWHSHAKRLLNFVSELQKKNEPRYQSSYQ